MPISHEICPSCGSASFETQTGGALSILGDHNKRSCHQCGAQWLPAVLLSRPFNNKPRFADAVECLRQRAKDIDDDERDGFADTYGGCAEFIEAAQILERLS